MVDKVRNPWMDHQCRDQFNGWVSVINDLQARVAALEGVGNAPALGSKAGLSARDGEVTP